MKKSLLLTTLFALPRFAEIATEVKLARKAILANHKPNRQGHLVNDFGKSIKVKADTKTKAKAKQER